MRKLLAVWCGSLLLLSASLASAAGIQGDYVEARTADVFTGPCISNAEVFITGSQAVMAWKVNQGSWKGTDLRGLCVAAAVQGTTTLSEDQPDKATTVLIVDQKATPAQRKALVRMAQELGGSRLKKIAAIKTARMSLEAGRPFRVGGRCGPGTRHTRHAQSPKGFLLGGRTGPDRDSSPR